MSHLKSCNPATYGGVFLICFSTLVVEIILTKIFSVTLWYHFSYMVISLAMFGIGFGGLLVYYFKDQFTVFVNDNLTYLSLAQAISTVLALYASLHYLLPASFGLRDLYNFVLVYVLCTAPFVLGSMILSILFLNWPERAARIYSFDLFGAAVGCVTCIILISYFSAPQVILIASLASAVAGICFGLPKVRLFAVALSACLLLLSVFANNFFKIDHTKNNYSEALNNIIFEKWSPLSRITVYPAILHKEKGKKGPFGWGLSDTYQSHDTINQMWIEQDASAGTPIVAFDGDFSKVNFLKYDLTALPYYLKKNASVFILGVGGGRDVLTALLFNSHDITAVDIHPVIVDLIQNKYADYVGHIYSDKRVSVAVSEGRSFLAKSKQRFDIIQIPLIDSWAATVAGAFAMSENSLYTTEAFVTFLNHVTPSGLLSISRFYFTPDNQTIKTAILARVALEKMGIQSAEKNIVVIKSTQQPNMVVLATLLIKQAPFTAMELATIKRVSAEMQFGIVYLPGYPHNEPLFETAMTTGNLSGFVNDYYYDIRPNTDDRPFFFQMLYFSKIKDLISDKQLTGQVMNYYAVVVIFFLLIISVVFVFLFYLLPMALSRTSRKLSLSWGGYFILLGLGFMFIEIPFLQQGAVYLGGPTYGLSVSLFGLLLFGGIGSSLSSRFQHRSLVNVLVLALIFVAMMAAFLPLYLHFLMEHTHGEPLMVKIVLFALALFPMALCMGVALPSGIRFAQYQYTDNIPWFWGLNGVASVLGSIIAMAISMGFGYSFTLVLGAIFYLSALVMLFVIRPGKFIVA